MLSFLFAFAALMMVLCIITVIVAFCCTVVAPAGSIVALNISTGYMTVVVAVAFSIVVPPLIAMPVMPIAVVRRFVTTISVPVHHMVTIWMRVMICHGLVVVGNDGASDGSQYSTEDSALDSTVTV